MEGKLARVVSGIRKFNRYYTNVLGLLDRHILESRFSLSEVRVLYEISQTEGCTSAELAKTLCMDSGYLSRIIKQFEKYGLVHKSKSLMDGRAQIIGLTAGGREKIARLNQRQDEQIQRLIRPLPEAEQAGLVRNMVSIENLLTGNVGVALPDIQVRHAIKPGDAGYITHLHGWVYNREHGYGTAFEAYVAQSFYDFLLNYNPGRDRLWIAEHNEEIVGSIGVVGRGESAQLRWFLLHPKYRGLGLGRRLFYDALAYCRSKGFKNAYLDTTDDLIEAIKLYRQAGFVKVAEKENHAWARDLTELRFELNFE